MQPPALPLSRPVEKAAVIAVFAALSLGTNYALIGIPNIKLMDSFVFLAAYLFGLRVGIGVAVSTWAVYGFVNPYGQDDLILLSFLILGECFYAVSASILARTSITARLSDGRIVLGQFSLIFGVAGLLATLAYDVLTNFASWVFRTGTIYQALLIGNIAGAPFSIVHEASNLVLFATVVPSAIISAKRYTGNLRTGLETR